MSGSKKVIADPNWIRGTDQWRDVMSRVPGRLFAPVESLAEDRITGVKYPFVRNLVHGIVESGSKSRPTSHILSPEEGAKLKAGAVTIRGVAYDDGQARAESVLVSLDRGTSWEPAEFDFPNGLYAWHQWKLRKTLQPDTYEIWAWATDALGRSRRPDGTIEENPTGRERTSIHKITVTVD